MLGYDFLFQDVDIIWYKNPLEYFRDPTNAAHQYDVFFQDDGGHSIRYAPYSANSGFYFVRHNDRTRHFLTSLLMAGDLVLETDSHQQALIALLNEHVSLYGLKAKVLSRDLDEFP
jgi:Nucleotide-diphospho-sugar transferase